MIFTDFSVVASAPEADLEGSFTSLRPPPGRASSPAGVAGKSCRG
jgi:hypothetical protein